MNRFTIYFVFEYKYPLEKSIGVSSTPYINIEGLQLIDFRKLFQVSF